MHLILTGATGLVGGAVLDAMLAMPEITRISILTRRPVPLIEDRIQKKDPVASNKDRVRVILHKDFAKYDDELINGPLRGAAGVVWALGISQLQVSKEDYVTITKTYSLAAAKAFARIPASDPTDASPPPASDPFRFVWVEGEGASTAPGFTTQRFGKVKGEVELALAEITNKGAASANGDSRRIEASSVRPAAVDPHNHTSLLPFVPPPASFAVGVVRDCLGGAIRALAPGFTSPTPALGTFLAQMAMGRYDAQIKGPDAPKGIQTVGTSFKILPNSVFRTLYGL